MDALEVLSHALQGHVPGGGDQIAVLVAHQRLREAVGGVLEVHPEPALDAEVAVVDAAAHVRGDSHQVLLVGVDHDLAADPAVGADGAGLLGLPMARRVPAPLVAERPHRARADALAAGDTSHVYKRQVIGRIDDGVVASVGEAPAPDAHDLAADAHAAAAQDAAVGVAGHVGVVITSLELQGMPAPRTHAHLVLVSVVLQATIPGRFAHGAIERVVAEQEFDHELAQPTDLVCVGLHDHAVAHLGGAGRHGPACPFDLDQAHAAGSVGLEPVVVAERRYIDPSRARNFQNRLAGSRRHFLAIHGQREGLLPGFAYDSHLLPPHRVEPTFIVTGPAPDADGRVDDVDLLLLARDGVDGARPHACTTAGARLRVNRVGRERGAGSRPALALVDVFLELLAKVLERGQHGVRRGAAKSTQRSRLDVFGQPLEQRDVGGDALPFTDTGERLEHALGAHTAGNALAATLSLREVQEEPSGVDDAVVGIEHHHAPGAHDGPGLVEGFVVHLRIEQRLRQAAAGRTTHLNRLEGFVVQDAPADGVDHIAQGEPHGHFGETRALDLSGEREDLGAFGLLVTTLREGRRSVGDDPRNAGHRLHVVDVGGPSPQTGLGREGRPQPWHAPLAFDRLHEGRLLAADKSPGALLDLQTEGEVAAHDVVADEAPLFRLSQSDLEALDGQGVLGPNIHVALRRADGVAADGHALEDGVRIAFQDGTVHERARVALVAVADEVLLTVRSGRLRGEFPFQAGGEAGAAPPPEPRSQYLLVHLGGCHPGEHLIQPLVATSLEVVVYSFWVDGAAVAVSYTH